MNIIVLGSTSIPNDFVAKAKINAEFVLAAIGGMTKRNESPPIPWTLALQPANQLIVEGLELLLKALLMKRGKTPPREHKLKRIYMRLSQVDKSLVNDVVCDAIARSATGAVPFGLPNLAGVTLRQHLVTGVDDAEEDRTCGYAEMDAPAFFGMLDAEWSTDSSQYLGVTPKFSIDKQTLRTNTRVLAGGILVCLMLPERLRDDSQQVMPTTQDHP